MQRSDLPRRRAYETFPGLYPLVVMSVQQVSEVDVQRPVKPAASYIHTIL